MTRDRQRDDPLGQFSEWHRNKLPNWYKWIDVDYTGYIGPNRWPQHAYKPYIVIELIHIKHRDAWGDDVPSRYPLHEHKKKFYVQLEKQTGIPTWVVWHPSACDQFIARRLGCGEMMTYHFEGRHEFAEFLDQQRERTINRHDSLGVEA